MREDRHLGGGICSEQASRNHHLLPRRRTAPSRVVGARKGRAAREARGAFVGRQAARAGQASDEEEEGAVRGGRRAQFCLRNLSKIFP